MSDRIAVIADAAMLLFIRQGYGKTQISHIAKAVGVSVGTIYLNFTGKKSIMQYVLKTIIDPAFADRELERPICEDCFTGLEDEIIDQFKRSEEGFQKHLENGGDGYSFELLISDAFDLLARYGAGCLFIEKNQYDFKKLATRYRAYRSAFFETMKQYFVLFIKKGTVRALDQLDLSVILTIEVLSWWAMDMRYTSFEIQDISLSKAKAACMDNLLSAYGKS